MSVRVTPGCRLSLKKVTRNVSYAPLPAARFESYPTKLPNVSKTPDETYARLGPPRQIRTAGRLRRFGGFGKTAPFAAMPYRGWVAGACNVASIARARLAEGVVG